MAGNTILLKKSSTAAKTPVAGDLEYGELAINYTDGKLHYKTASNAIDTFASNSATATLTNKTLSSTTLTGTLTAGGSVGTSGQILSSTLTGVQWVSPAATISVSNYNTAGTVSGSVTGVSTLRFDNDTGISVSDLGSGAVKISLGSSFKTWKVTGQSDLVAFGEDTISLIAGSGVSLTTNPSGSPYKSLTIGVDTTSVAKFTTSSSAPASPAAGDRWLNSTTGIFYTYVNDGDSSQWVDLGDRAGSGNASASLYDSQYLLTGTTTNATETEILVGGLSRVAVTLGKTAYYTIDIVARRTDVTGGHGAFRLQGAVNNNAGTVADLGGIVETIIYRSNGNYQVDARADNTNDSINIYVTGVVGHTINWRAVITIVEV